MSKSVVSIVKGPRNVTQSDIDAMVEKTFELMGGVENLIRPGMNVVLKPNMGHVARPEESVCTSPQVVRAVARAVKKAAPAKIIIAEAAATGVDTMRAMEAGGMAKVAQEEGLELLDLKGEGIKLYTHKVENPLCAIKQIQLPSILSDENTYFINIPIMKAHTCCMFTNALKNLKGCVQDHHHYIMHCTNLLGAMFDLGEALVPDLNIVDMIKPLEGFGPHSGYPVEYDMIVAGKDIIAVDATCCRIASIELDQLEYFEMARRKHLGEFEEENIEIVGEPLEKVRKHMYIPYLKGTENWPEYHIHIENGCSSCQSLLSYTMARLQAMPEEYQKHAGMHIICVRQGKLPDDVKPGDEIMFFGDCTIPLKKKLEDSGEADQYRIYFSAGCPPQETLPLWAITDMKCYNGDDLDFNPRERHSSELVEFNKWMEAERKRLAASGELQDSIQVYSEA